MKQYKVFLLKVDLFRVGSFTFPELVLVTKMPLEQRKLVRVTTQKLAIVQQITTC